MLANARIDISAMNKPKNHNSVNDSEIRIPGYNVICGGRGTLVLGLIVFWGFKIKILLIYTEICKPNDWSYLISSW